MSVKNFVLLSFRDKPLAEKMPPILPSVGKTWGKAAAYTLCICTRKQTEHISDSPDLPADVGLPRAAFKCLITQSVKKWERERVECTFEFLEHSVLTWHIKG